MARVLHLPKPQIFGALGHCDGPDYLPGATWYQSGAINTADDYWAIHGTGDGLHWDFPTGTLADFGWISFDLLTTSLHSLCLRLTLSEGADGPTFALTFSVLDSAQARVRFDLREVGMNRWMLPREGAWLKPCTAGVRVDLTKVDRMRLEIMRKAEPPCCFCMTPPSASTNEPPVLTEPLLPHGALLDALGQSTRLDWPDKTRSEQELITRVLEHKRRGPNVQFPANYSRYGGWKEVRLAATGFFRTAWHQERWWLVDPEGYLFWSSGLDCVREHVTSAVGGLTAALTWVPPQDGPWAKVHMNRYQNCANINYLGANLIRALGNEWQTDWAALTVGMLKDWGFNTVGNWSNWEMLRPHGAVYVRPLEFKPSRTANVFRDFPDVYDPAFALDAADYAQQLTATAGDPLLLGYFLMNEPKWGFAQETPAEGMLFNTPECHTRRALAAALREQYPTDAALAAAWGLPVTLAQVAQGPWHLPFTPAAQADLQRFSTQMVARLFTILTAACRAVDGQHLNLGARYYTIPPAWALAGMGSFDVFSINCYQPQVLRQAAAASAQMNCPVLIGEWHFGALDAGLPGSGIGRVRNQTDRGRAFRAYVEDAATQPWCVGVHYFTLYDESPLGRFDGENWNIGFMDVCMREYEPMVRAAQATHARLYAVASGQTPPFNDVPEYLPPLFF